jgi:plasmid maintenance system antidote protein VapI
MDIHTTQKLTYTVGNAYNPNHMLDTLMRKMDIENDTALARKLKVTTPTITMMREGRISISASMMICFHKASGMSVRELRELLEDRRANYRLTCK